MKLVVKYCKYRIKDSPKVGKEELMKPVVKCCKYRIKGHPKGEIMNLSNVANTESKEAQAKTQAGLKMCSKYF